MLAKINQTKGYVVVNGGKKHSGSRENLNDDFSNFEPMIEKKFFDKTKAKKSYKDFIDSNLNLTKFADCDVDFKLTFQVWNCESRILRDITHMQQPICTYQVMKKLVHIEDPMSTFGQMTFIQNKYQSSAEILQNGDLLHLYRDFDKIFTLNVVTKES